MPAIQCFFGIAGIFFGCVKVFEKKRVLVYNTKNEDEFEPTGGQPHGHTIKTSRAQFLKGRTVYSNHQLSRLQASPVEYEHQNPRESPSRAQ